MKTALEKMMAGSSCDEVLKAAVVETNEEREQFIAQVHHQTIAEIGTYVQVTLHNVGTQKTFIAGCMLELFHHLVERIHNQDLYDNLLEDLNLKSNQAYRCRAVWRAFGERFVQEPKLFSEFVSESLKILASDSVPQSARDEALELARDNRRVTIKVAQRIIKKHCGTPKRVKKTPKTNATKGWKCFFQGAFLKVLLGKASLSTESDLTTAIEELETALNELRQKQHESQLTSITVS